MSKTSIEIPDGRVVTADSDTGTLEAALEQLQFTGASQQRIALVEGWLGDQRVQTAAYSFQMTPDYDNGLFPMAIDQMGDIPLED